MSARRLAGVGAATLLVALAGCSTGDEPAPTPSISQSVAPTTTTSGPPSSTATPSSPPSPTSEEGSLDEFDLEGKEGGGFPSLGRKAGTAAQVRVGHHDGYDRVVFDFDGEETPAYSVTYVDEPTGDGSGDQVAVEGDAYLEVLVASLGYPDGDQSPPTDLAASDFDGTVVAQADVIFGGFEGIGQTFIGVRGDKRPFRVSVETDPSRLVVDIAR